MNDEKQATLCALVLNLAFAALAVLALNRDPSPMLFVADCLNGLGWVVTLA